MDVHHFHKTFNSITVDSDMSTSDMVLLISLKNGEVKLNSKKSKLFFGVGRIAAWARKTSVSFISWQGQGERLGHAKPSTKISRMTLDN